MSELFGEEHEQEQFGLYGTEHEKQQLGQQPITPEDFSRELWNRFISKGLNDKCDYSYKDVLTFVKQHLNK